MIEDRVKNVLSIVLNVDEYNIIDSSSPETITEWDSLNHYNIVTSLEEEFEIQFSDDQILEMQSYKLICTVIFEVLSC